MTAQCVRCGKTVSVVDGSTGAVNELDEFTCHMCLSGVTDQKIYNQIIKLIEQIPTKRYGELNLVLAKELGLYLMSLEVAETIKAIARAVKKKVT